VAHGSGLAGRAGRGRGPGGSVGGTPHDDWDVPGLPAQAGTDLLREQFPAASGAADRVVVHDRSGAPVPASQVEALADRLASMPHVSAVSPGRTSADGDTVLLDVQYDVPVTHEDLMGELGPLERAVAPAQQAGLQVELGGDVPDSATLEVGGTGELVGVTVALVLLVLTFGSVVAAGLPILVALMGLGVGSSAVLLLAAVMDVSTSAPTVATMVGLGVGIDYALLLVSRHVEALQSGVDVRPQRPAPPPPPDARSCSRRRQCWCRCSGCGWPACRRTRRSASRRRWPCWQWPAPP
jgi:RND superfamily putative drug exporter